MAIQKNPSATKTSKKL
jgi:deoxyhypusine synthase